ncbi:transglutaminase domain-containing protein [Pedobacter sp. SYSU D00535]|uniref:transglutaminase domain-containing protein n=1 Tax=Pedobacter sp. SYSU D00535 TaxID=2810308 RepID=UPI001A97975A|nr:transglutaminase domain-containing protein [Pedobacter sp. SYSU D00535]
MLKNLFLSLMIAFVAVIKSFAVEPDSSVLITSAVTEIKFEWNGKTSQVKVRQKEVLNYLAEGYNANIQVAEFYDNDTEIDQVSCTVNGYKPLGFSPQYSHHSIDGIFYSDARVCHFPIVLKEKGNKATSTIVKTTEDPRYFCNLYFTEPYRIQSREIRVSVPRWMKLDIKELNFGPNIFKTVRYDKRDDADVFTYQVSNLAPQKAEPESPGPTYLYPHLLFLPKSASYNGTSITYFNTLADQYAWYKAVAVNGENREAVKAKALELTQGLSDDLQKIKKIFYWVQDNVRYIAFEDGIAGFRPDKADEVLRKKYGDCKGMANLTKNLLVALGFDARLCWIGTNHIAYDYSTPSLAVDNHMICAVNYKGKQYFLDATETYLPFNEYAERIQGRQVLIEDGEKYILSKIPATSVSQNLDYEKRLLNLQAAALQGTAQHSYKGEEKEYMLSRINALKKSDYENSLMKYLSSGEENTVKNVTTSDLNNYDEELSIRYNVVQKSGISSFDKEYYVEMDLRKEFGNFQIDEASRRHDYWLPYKFNIERETELKIPSDYTVGSLPQDLSIRNANYEFKISYRQEGDKVFYKKTLRFQNPRIQRAQFAQWNADIKKLNTAYNETVILKPKS